METKLLLVLMISWAVCCSAVSAADNTNKTQNSKSDTNKVQDAKSDAKANTDFPGGTFTMKDLQIETDILANRAMTSIAKRIASDITKSQAKSVAFYDESDYKALFDYQSVMSYLEQAQNQYQDIANQITESGKHTLPLAGADAALKEAQGIAQSIVSIISLLRSEVVVEGKQVSLAEDALIASICSNLPKETTNYYTKVFVPSPNLQRSALQDAIERVNRARLGAVKAIAEAAKKPNSPGAAHGNVPENVRETPAKKKTEPTDATPKKDNAPAPSDPPTDANEGAPSFAQLIKDINKSYGSIMAGLYGTGKESGMMSALTRAEKMYELTRNSDVIYLKVVSAGGNNATSRNLLTAIFSTPRVFHSGGCIISYIQFTKDGAIRNSGEFEAYTGFYRSNISGVADLTPNVQVESRTLSQRQPARSPKDNGERR